MDTSINIMATMTITNYKDIDFGLLTYMLMMILFRDPKSLLKRGSKFIILITAIAVATTVVA